MQIRTRLTGSFFGIAAAILAALLGYVYWTFKHDTEEAFYQNLRSKATIAAQALMPDADALPPLPPALGDDDGLLPYADNTSLYNNAYERVFSAEAGAPAVPVRVLQEVQRGGEQRFAHYNLQALARAVQSARGRPFVLVVEGYFDPAGIAKLRQILLFSFLAGCAVLFGACWYFAGLALRPVSRIMDQVNRLSPAAPALRLETGPNRDEISRLADTFNRLLDRVERAFRMQRMFLSNVSHELKNPLMVIRSQIEVALQRERDPEAYRRSLQSVLDDVNALGEVEEKLLQLARLHNDAGSIGREAVRLDELLWQCREQLLKRHPDYRATLEFEAMPPSDERLVVQVNEALLRTALLNLMDNACKYSPDHRVIVRAHFAADGAHRIAVCDRGPGIPPEEIPLLFEPFYRSERHRAEKGTGIGLSLTKTILDWHGIGLEAGDGPEGGAAFRLLFPAAF